MEFHVCPDAHFLVRGLGAELDPGCMGWCGLHDSMRPDVVGEVSVSALYTSRFSCESLAGETYNTTDLCELPFKHC